jgi:hypothetical protein
MGIKLSDDEPTQIWPRPVHTPALNRKPAAGPSSPPVATCAGCGDVVPAEDLSLSGALCARCAYCYGEPGY